MYGVSPAHCHLMGCVLEAYASNDGVAIIVGDKVLDGPCWSYSQMIATNKMGWDFELGGVRARIP